MLKFIVLLFLCAGYVNLSFGDAVIFSGDGVKALKNKIKFKDGGDVTYDGINIDINVDNSSVHQIQSNGSLLLQGFSSAGRLKIGESTSNGTDFIGIYGANDLAVSYNLVLPNVAPIANQFLQSDALGNLSWVTSATIDGTRIQDGSNNSYVDTDEIPGGVIINASNGGDSTDIVVGPTGSITIKASPTPSTNRPEIRLTEAQVNGTDYVGLRPPSSLASSFSLTLPTAQAGAANRRLVGDATGQLSFIAPDTVEPDITEANGWSAFTTAGSGQYLFAGSDILSTELVLYEANATGGLIGNSISLTVPLDVTADYSITLPASAPPAANYILQADASGTLSWIPTPAGGGGGDSTRIEDAATSTFVDTDATARTISFGADNLGADATCRFAFDSVGTIDRNKFFFGNCNAGQFEMLNQDLSDSDGYDVPVLSIKQNTSGLPERVKSGVLQFYNVNSSDGQVGWNIRAPNYTLWEGAFYMTLPFDTPTVGEVLKISSVTNVAGSIHEYSTEWNTISKIQDAAGTTYIDADFVPNFLWMQAGDGSTARLGGGDFRLQSNLGSTIDNVELQFYEDPDVGTEYIGVKAPTSIGTSYSIQLPSATPFSGQRLVVGSFSANVANMIWDSYDIAYNCILSYRTDDNVGGGPSTASVASSFDKRRFTNAEGNCAYTGLSGTPVADATSIGDQYYTQFRLYGFQTTYFVHCTANTSPSSTGDLLAIREPISGGVIYGKNANPGEPLTVSAVIVTPNPSQYYDYELVQYSASANADGHGAAVTWLSTTYEEHATCQIRVDNRF